MSHFRFTKYRIADIARWLINSSLSAFYVIYRLIVFKIIRYHSINHHKLITTNHHLNCTLDGTIGSASGSCSESVIIRFLTLFLFTILTLLQTKITRAHTVFICIITQNQDGHFAPELLNFYRH